MRPASPPAGTASTTQPDRPWPATARQPGLKTVSRTTLDPTSPRHHKYQTRSTPVSPVDKQLRALPTAGPWPVQAPEDPEPAPIRQPHRRPGAPEPIVTSTRPDQPAYRAEGRRPWTPPPPEHERQRSSWPRRCHSHRTRVSTMTIRPSLPNRTCQHCGDVEVKMGPPTSACLFSISASHAGPTTHNPPMRYHPHHREEAGHADVARLARPPPQLVTRRRRRAPRNHTVCHRCGGTKSKLLTPNKFNPDFF